MPSSFPSPGQLYRWEFEKAGRRHGGRGRGPLTLGDQELMAWAPPALGAGLPSSRAQCPAASARVPAEARAVRWCPPISRYFLYYFPLSGPVPAAMRASSNMMRQNFGKRLGERAWNESETAGGPDRGAWYLAVGRPSSPPAWLHRHDVCDYWLCPCCSSPSAPASPRAQWVVEAYVLLPLGAALGGGALGTSRPPARRSEIASSSSPRLGLLRSPLVRPPSFSSGCFSIGAS